MEARREALALLDRRPEEADFLLHEVLAADSEPAELLLVRKYLVPYLSSETADLLWKTVRAPRPRRAFGSDMPPSSPRSQRKNAQVATGGGSRCCRYALRKRPAAHAIGPTPSAS